MTNHVNRNRRGIAASIALTALLLLGAAPVRAEPVVLEVAGGEQARRDTPVVFELPEALRGHPVVLERIEGDRATAVPTQPAIARDDAPPRLRFILAGELEPGQTRRYRLRAVDAAPSTGGAGVALTDDGKRLVYRVGGRETIGYNYAVVPQPEGVKDLYARSGYIHPVRTPGGLLITNDFPEKHLHHHGVWFPWTNTTFMGKRTDFWNSGAGQAKVEFVKFTPAGHGDGPVFGWFQSRHRHVALNTEGGPTPALNETWTVRVYNVPETMFDLESVQTCATDAPLILHEYRYGGLGLRGSGQWEGKGDAVKFLTSEGRTRADGHATRSRWCAMFGQIDGKPAGIAVLCHPDNFRFPQAMRIHPNEPFFNYAPVQTGEFRIEPGKPYVSRYRFVAYDGHASAEQLERWWNDYANPPTVRVVD